MNFLFTSFPPKLRGLVILVTFLLIMGNGFASIIPTPRAVSEEMPGMQPHVIFEEPVDKSLDIERYDNEPLQLVELKIGDQAISNKITPKFRRNNEGLDTVSFKETDGWFRRLNLKFRNVSGKTILGVQAHLYFHPPNEKTLYSLPLASSTLLNQQTVAPEGAISLVVTEQAWTLTTGILKRYDVNADLASVSFAVDRVAFIDDLQWSRGLILHRDPTNAYRWIPVDKKTPQ